MPLLLGAIADDFTGATDLANTLVGQGMRTVQLIGAPDRELHVGDAEAVVIALKSRTAPVGEAVRQSLEALAWLRRAGARQFFFKYCSTFDSTAEGNIGPVADALMQALGTGFATVCPAFPANGRTVYRGHLFVGDTLLSESSMKDHPLTPMRDSNLCRLMAQQSTRDVGLADHTTVAQGTAALRRRFKVLKDAGASYAVLDAITDADLRTIGTALADHALITGGSGVAVGLPANFRAAGELSEPVTPHMPSIAGRAAVLSGSCSAATRAQVAYARQRWPHFRLDADRIAAGEPVAAEALDWAAAQVESVPVLIYGSADPHEVAAIQARHGREKAGAFMEETISAIASGLVDAGTSRIIVAGGETSGAVVSALGMRALRIGPEIDPGVPWTESLGAPRLALALKSGNFGGDDFFEKAMGMFT